MSLSTNVLKTLLFISVLSATVFPQSVANSYTVGQAVAIGGNSTYYVQITGAPSNAVITNVQAKFDYIAYGVVQNYVSVRFNKGTDPGTSGGTALVSQGSLPTGNPGTYGYVSLNNWNGQAVNSNYYFNFSVASASPFTATINTIYVTVSYSVPTLSVTSPNGGESWQAGTTHNITWTSTGTITGNIQIQPYLNGVAQTNIAGVANTGSYSWAIPADYPPGTTYQMSISAMSGTVWDFSNANFTIVAPATPPTLTVTSPNGGESWQAGTTHNITWTSTGTITGNIQIQPYLNGVAQTNIAGVANTGSYSWAIPADYPPGTTYQMSISAMSGTVWDFSNANFTIVAPVTPPTLTVTSPNGGESWQEGTQQTITWANTNYTGAVHIQFYKGGTAPANALQNITGSAANTGSYTFTVPTTLTPGSDYKIGISDASTGIPSDFSDNYFTIAAGSSIAITSPNGGESWQMGTQQTITWANTNYTGAVHIQFYKGGTAPANALQNITGSAANTGSYTFTVPTTLTPGSDYKIGISDASTGIPSDFSDNYFTIAAGSSIAITSPNGGESWQMGTQQTITWANTNYTGAVHIQFYKGGTAPANALQNITGSAANTGSYTFTVPTTLTPGSDYKIGISDASTGIPSDFSDNYFTIAAGSSIAITSPNGGESWQMGTQQTITWANTNYTGAVHIQFYKGGTAPANALQNITGSAANTGSYAFTVPTTLTAGSDYKIGISDGSTGIPSDFSDNYFTITTNNPTTPSIQLKFPILNKTSSTITITSVLDHSPHHAYPYRNYKVGSKPLFPIIDFMNERAGLTNKDWNLYKTQCGGKNSNINKFLNGYTYRQSDKTVWYAGHPAYDYSWGQDIYADAPGTVFYPKTDADFGYRIHSGCLPPDYGVLGIDHRNPPFQGSGYVSYFMHLKTHPKLNNGKYIDLPEIVSEGTVISQSQVDNGYKIGIAGAVGAGKKNGSSLHLHYELHWINSKGDHIIVDPYGWSPSDNSVDSLPLSEFNLRNGGVGDDRPATDKSKYLWSGTAIASITSLNKLQKSLSNNSSWRQISSPVSATFCGVCFPSNSIGYICGNEGVILKTTDGGATWQTAYSNANVFINKIFFSSTSVGIAVGKNIILQTTDGGTTWQNRWLNAAQATTWDTTNNAIFLDRITFSPNGTGFVSGCYVNNQNISPVLWRSTSGGASWDYIAQFMATGNYNEKFVGGLYFVSDSIGYAGVYIRNYGADSGVLTLDSNKIYKTKDGGTSWYESTVADNIGDIRFVSADTGYAFGYSKLFKTVTGTSNQPVWYTADTFPSGINDIAISAGSLICVGNNGKIATSGNGGTWIDDSSGTTSDLNAICLKDAVTCAVGANGTILIKDYFVDSRRNRATLLGQTQLCSVNEKCLRYYLSAPNHVTIRIADLKGRVIENIENCQKSEGIYSINFKLRNQSKGVYFVWFRAGDYVQTEKIFLLGRK